MNDRWEQKQHQANGHRGAETMKASSKIIVANGSHCILIFPGLDLVQCSRGVQVWRFDCLRETVIGWCTLLLHARPHRWLMSATLGWATKLEVPRSRILPKPYQTYHMLSRRPRTRRGTAAVLLVTRLRKLAKEGVSGRWVRAPCYRPAGASELQQHAWAACRRSRLEASGLGRGARAIALVFPK